MDPLLQSLIPLLWEISVPPSPGIWFSTQLARAVLCVPRELSHKPRPAYLPLIQLPLGGEILQILVICKHLNWLARINEVGAPFFEGSDDGEKFLIIYLAVALRRRVLLREESDWPERSFVVRLRKDSCRDIICGAGFHHNSFFIFKVQEDRRRGELILQALK